MDDYFRRVERAAAGGDPEAEILLQKLYRRCGYFFRDHKRDEILTEWEELQQDYDDIFWHQKGPKYFMWGGYCSCCRDVSKWSEKLVKAHKPSPKHTPKNFKRKTLRTHRDGSRKNYKLKRRRDIRTDEVSISDIKKERTRRRKKRFGGRERLYGCEWVWDSQAERYSRVYWCRVPDSDELI
jgi:hypothetical protein